jgi:hypothetical protein
MNKSDCVRCLESLFNSAFLQLKAIIGWATIDEESLPGVREENALAILANLSMQQEVGRGTSMHIWGDG